MPRERTIWYAAHIIMAVKWVSRKQRRFPIHENVVIFRGRSPEVIRQLAIKYARDEYEGDASLTLDGHPARMVFVGIRKIVECRDSTAGAIKRSTTRRVSLGVGTEVTYSVFAVKGAAALKALSAGKAVSLVYDDA